MMSWYELIMCQSLMKSLITLVVIFFFKLKMIFLYSYQYNLWCNISVITNLENKKRASMSSSLQYDLTVSSILGIRIHSPLNFCKILWSITLWGIKSKNISTFKRVWSSHQKLMIYHVVGFHLGSNIIQHFHYILSWDEDKIFYIYKMNFCTK